jgi:hypothetical protein
MQEREETRKRLPHGISPNFETTNYKQKHCAKDLGRMERKDKKEFSDKQAINTIEWLLAIDIGQQ